MSGRFDPENSSTAASDESRDRAAQTILMQDVEAILSLVLTSTEESGGVMDRLRMELVDDAIALLRPVAERRIAALDYATILSWYTALAQRISVDLRRLSDLGGVPTADLPQQ